MHAMCVVILALGLQPRQRLVKVRAKSEARESHFMLPKVWESVREWTFTLLSELPLWEFEFWWTNLQITSVKVKTHWIEKLFISLERSWNLKM